RVAIVDGGRVVVDGTPEDLKGELSGDTVQVELADAADAARAVATLSLGTAVRDLRIDGKTVLGRADSGARAVPNVLAVLEEAGISVLSVSVARPSLDDVYLRYAGRRFGVAA
ncbi:MAG: type transport system ATP-binding protein, partial [Frankiaceae bacterium]|nr:type transport system ATP-binding protein [Frankiaceae bacterium]